MIPYNRQTYDQLESVLRRTGDDQAADDVFIARGDRERELCWPDHRLRFCEYTIYRWLVGYGVRTNWLLRWVLVVLAIGTILYDQPGAVIPRVATSNPQSIQAAVSQVPLRLSLFDAFWVSLGQFLPFEIPAGSQWRPNDGIVSTVFGTILRLLGWIFVPLGAAGLTGLLRRLRH